MTSPKLRPHQIAALDRLAAEFRKRRRSPLLIAPTGSGKTVMAAELMRREVETGRRVLFIAPRRELIYQASETLMRFGVRHGRLLAGEPHRDCRASIRMAGRLSS